MADITSAPSPASTPKSSSRPLQWLRKLTGKQSTTGLSAAQEQTLQQDLQELTGRIAGFTACTIEDSQSSGSPASTISGSISLWGDKDLQALVIQEDLACFKNENQRSSTNYTLTSSSSDPQTVLVLSCSSTEKQHEQQYYSLKRLPPLSITASNTPMRRGDKKALQQQRQQKTASLIHEATLLAKIGWHPNVMRLRGLPGNVASSEHGCLFDHYIQTNSFFFLTDPLHVETLRDRLQQWRQTATESAAAVLTPKNSSSLTDLLLLSGATPTLEYLYIPNERAMARKTSYAYQIAKAIQACHAAGILVRDLSPHKIGFKRNDPHVVQLMDLGNAIDTTRHSDDVTDAVSSSPTTKTASMMSTPADRLVGKRRYMAGEIWRTGQYSTATDVYSWAMVYYELLSERKPFEGLTALEHQKFVCSEEVSYAERPLIEDYCWPGQIEQLLQQGWHADPEKRPTVDRVCRDMQQLVLHLDSCLFLDDEEGLPMEEVCHIMDDHDFLLDVHVRPNQEEDAVSDLGDTVDPEIAADRVDDDLWSLLGIEQDADAPPSFSDTNLGGDETKEEVPSRMPSASTSSSTVTPQDYGPEESLEASLSPIKIPSRTSSCATILTEQKNPTKIVSSAA